MKKLLGLALIGCLGLSLTGCKGNLNDVEKQIDKMEEVVEAGDIFKEDWKVTIEYKDEDGDVTSKVVYRKDGENFYGVGQEFDDGRESITRVWFIKTSGGYNAYRDENDVKVSEFVSDEDFESYSMNTLVMVYETYGDMVKEAVELCDLEGYTCSVEKKLFGKVILNMEYSDAKPEVGEGMLEEVNPFAGATVSFVLHKGKLVEINMNRETGKASIVVDYSNQDIDEPNASSFNPAE